MLFLQGSRDEFAEAALITPLMSRLGERATLTWLKEADHSFHVPVRSGRTDSEVRTELLEALAAWARSVTRQP